MRIVPNPTHADIHETGRGLLEGHMLSLRRNWQGEENRKLGASVCRSEAASGFARFTGMLVDATLKRFLQLMLRMLCSLVLMILDMYLLHFYG